jgi:NAD(P)H-hydrate epimerase
MKILSGKQIKILDQKTAEFEGISTFQLMDRAAERFFQWMMQKNKGKYDQLCIFAGPGNNGGDGLVVARLSTPYFKAVMVVTIHQSNNHSAEYEYQFKKLPKAVNVVQIKNKKDISKIPMNKSLIIDAIFGSGINREPEGLYAEIINHINHSHQEVYAIDVPSGLFIDSFNQSDNIIHASRTCTFELPKLSFFFLENYKYTGDWEVISINLNKAYISGAKTDYILLDFLMISQMIKKRTAFHHKGSFGHALIAAGSEGMAGAAVLAVKASLKSGSGKTSAIIPDVCTDIMQLSIPEAMVQKGHGRSVLIDFNSATSAQAIGIGPGIGNNIKTKRALEDYLEGDAMMPVVLDADALNIIAENKILHKIPPNSIITPHPAEYKRLFGESKNSLLRLNNQILNSKKYNIYIVHKGAYTTISTPDGHLFFNHTGNPGMATAGSGDVLTGILTSLLAQKYTTLEACQIGVFVHGYAGDLAAQKTGHIGLIASDIIDYLPAAFNTLYKVENE